MDGQPLGSQLYYYQTAIIQVLSVTFQIRFKEAVHSELQPLGCSDEHTQPARPVLKPSNVLCTSICASEEWLRFGLLLLYPRGPVY